MEIMVERPTEFAVGGGGLTALVTLPPSKGGIITQLQAQGTGIRGDLGRRAEEIAGGL
jgi:hypothetical protein